MPAEPLRIEDQPNPESGRRILRLHGPLLISNLFEFQSTVRANTSRALILDLNDVPYVDSGGIGVLIGAYVRHQKEGHSLALVGASDRVRAALKVTRVDQFFRFFDSVSDAERASAA